LPDGQLENGALRLGQARAVGINTIGEFFENGVFAEQIIVLQAVGVGEQIQRVLRVQLFHQVPHRQIRFEDFLPGADRRGLFPAVAQKSPQLREEGHPVHRPALVARGQPLQSRAVRQIRTQLGEGGDGAPVIETHENVPDVENEGLRLHAPLK
jgi:hypothetical protein